MGQEEKTLEAVLFLISYGDPEPFCRLDSHNVTGTWKGKEVGRVGALL